jgi:PAS domain S-box-containing protein
VRKPGRPGRSAGRRSAVVLGALLVVAVSVVDVVVGADVTLISLLVAGPLVAAWSAEPAGTGAVAALAVAAAVPLGQVSMSFLSIEHVVEIVGVALVGVLSTMAAQAQARVEVSRRRSEFIAGAGRLLEALPEPDALLERITRLAIPELADLCIVDLIAEDGRITGAATAAGDPEAAKALRAMHERYPLDPAGEHPAAVALRTGSAQLLSELTPGDLGRFAAGPEHLELMRRLRYTSAVVVPLRARGRTLGVISFLRLAGAPSYTPADLELAREIARRCGLALDNARLFAELRRTERRLETILENLGEAVTVQGPAFHLVYVNSAAARLLGFDTPREAVAAGIGRLSTQFLLLDMDGRAIADEDYPGPRAARGENPAPLLARAVPREGGEERWLLIKATTVRGEGGELLLIVNVLQDVTETQRIEHHQRVLSAAGRLIGSSLDLDETLERLASAIVPAVGDWCRVDLADPRGALHHVAFAAASEEHRGRLQEMHAAYRPDPEHEPLNYRVLRTGEPVLASGIDPAGEQAYARDAHHLALIRALGTRSAAIVPIAVGGRSLGTITVGEAESGRRLAAPELELLTEIAERAGVAVENARVHAARSHIATTLQRSLLPPRLPDVPGLSIAARFRAAGEAADVGGDFYDLFPLGPDAWMVVIGDVTGKGPEAAAITSLARYTVRTAAAYEQAPAAVLRRLHEALREEPGRHRLCTALCLRIERGGGEGFTVCAASGGHPLPYRLAPGRPPQLVGRTGALLGAFPGVTWPQTVETLAPGEALVLYTDGVTDTRGADERFGQARLEALLAGLGGAPADEIAGQIDHALQEFDAGEQRDDVAILVLAASG